MHAKISLFYRENRFEEIIGLLKDTQLVRGRADIKTQFRLCSKTLHLIITPHGLSMSGNLEGE